MPLIEPGRMAPAFTLPDQDGERHALKDYRGRAVVLYFYPKDDTSGCTKEACAFRDLLPKFDGVDAAILGASPDDEASHAKFASKHDLPFTLLADVPPKKGAAPKVCDRYGVWQEKSMYGRTYMGVVRTTYLIDAAGRVAQRWDRVKVPGHAEAVLAAVESLP
ncbi:MAG: peroxiredoxin [Planctomycetota bacterium]|jgi:peroxiredoxin Q/BCP